MFANSQPSVSNFKSFSQSLEQFFLTVGQNNLVTKYHLCFREGDDIQSAKVGDRLALRFEIQDKSNSPYEIFVRELIASDGIDASEILLIDSIG